MGGGGGKKGVSTRSHPTRPCQCSVYTRLHLLRWVSTRRGGPRSPHTAGSNDSHDGGGGGTGRRPTRQPRGDEWDPATGRGTLSLPRRWVRAARWRGFPWVFRGFSRPSPGVARSPLSPLRRPWGAGGGLHFPECSGGGGEPASSREEESAEVARRGPEAPLPWRREPGPGPTMAETDPKTVQDLTAVVSPPGLGQPPRGVRGEAGSGERGAEPPPWGEAPAGRGRSLRPGPVGGPWRYLPGPSLGNPRLPAVGGAAGLVVSPGSFPRVVA